MDRKISPNLLKISHNIDFQILKSISSRVFFVKIDIYWPIAILGHFWKKVVPTEILTKFDKTFPSDRFPRSKANLLMGILYKFNIYSPMGIIMAV